MAAGAAFLCLSLPVHAQLELSDVAGAVALGKAMKDGVGDLLPTKDEVKKLLDGRKTRRYVAEFLTNDHSVDDTNIRCYVALRLEAGYGERQAAAQCAVGGGASAAISPRTTPHASSAPGSVSEDFAIELLQGSVNNTFATHSLDSVVDLSKYAMDRVAGVDPGRSNLRMGVWEGQSGNLAEPQSLIGTLRHWEDFLPDWEGGHICYGLSRKYMEKLVETEADRLGYGDPPYSIEECEALVQRAIDIRYRNMARIGYGMEHDTLIHLAYWRGYAYLDDYKRGGYPAVAAALRADARAVPELRREHLADEIEKLAD